MTQPAPPPAFTISSATQIQAGQTRDLVMSNVDPFALWTIWIALSAATDSSFPQFGVAEWGASIIDQNTGQTMLRCQVHISGPDNNACNSNSLWLGGLVVAEKNAPFRVSFVTDPGTPHLWSRANAGIYYGQVPA